MTTIYKQTSQEAAAHAEKILYNFLVQELINDRRMPGERPLRQSEVYISPAILAQLRSRAHEFCSR